MLKTENLCFSYPSNEDKPGKLVINELNLTIEKGSFVAILGHNGSGKSTLAKHFNAILLPTGGKVYALGMDTSCEEKVFDIRSNVGMVFQNPDNQIVTSIVEDEVAFAAENLGIDPKEIRKRVDNALSLVGMSEYALSNPSQLSGGQKQRIAIASALAMEPCCIVLDEPTAMLDPAGREEIMATIKRLNRENGLTVVLITHYMDEAALSDRVIVMNKGEIAYDATPKEVFSHVSFLKNIGLDVPQVTELFHLLREKGVSLPDNVIDLDEACSFLYDLLKEN